MNSSNNTTSPSNILFLWSVWTTAALFFLYEFLLRISPSVVTQELMSSFHINAVHVGILSALFYYCYALLQLPAGLLLDRFNVRHLILSSCLISVVGVFLFAMTHTYWVAALARCLMGFGGAFSFISALKLASLILPRKHFTIAAGCLGTLGFAGAIVGDNALSALNHFFGFKNTVLVLAMFGIFIFIIIAVMTQKISDEFKQNDHQLAINKPHITQSIMHLLRNKRIILISLMAGLLYLPSSVFAELWGIPFLQAAYTISKSQTVAMITLSFVGWTIGAPLLAWFATQLKNSYNLIIVCCIINIAILCSIIYLHFSSITLLCIFLFGFGFFSGIQLLPYPLIATIAPRQSVASGIAIANICTVLAPAISQPLVGKILDWSWQGAMINHVRWYSAISYKIAFCFLPLAFIATIFISLYLNYIEKYTQSD